MKPERWRQVDRILQELLELAADERPQFLERACADDPPLREEVEELARSHEAASGFMESYAFFGAAAPVSSMAHSLPESSGVDGPDRIVPGIQLGPYKIEEQLAAGGMGQVFRATDLRLMRQVAIKTLVLAHGGTPGSSDRVLREARSASALNHPNIVTVYDVGHLDRLAYIVMELVEGQTLSELIASDRLPIVKVLAIAGQIASALVAAHEKGIIHRDLKPANIMVTPEGLAKILDFGLAKRSLPQRESDSVQPTNSEPPKAKSAIWGTCGYMSPEQVRGETLDFRSDQFSFGAVLYEMVTGHRAFPGDTPTETLAALMRDSSETMRRFDAGVPAPLEWIVHRCLARNSQDRYESTIDLSNDLHSLAGSLSQRSPARAPAHNLPLQRTALVGRKRELTRVRQLIMRPNVRLVTLTGPGGIGKTRLGLELAHQLTGKFPGGIVFVPLDRISDPLLVLSEIASALNLRLVGDQSVRSLLDRHMQSLTASTLLVLDNFEHVVAAASAVMDLMASSDQLKVVVTSRAALNVYGEYEFPVPPLDLADYTKLPHKTIARSSAVALFLERATSLQSGDKVDSERIRLIAEICTRLDGLPLAIELAAARTRVLPLRALLEGVQHPLNFLIGGAKDLPERQRTLRATLDWSHNLLDPQQKKLFRRLSIFVGGATYEAIEAVTNAKGDLDLNLQEGIEALVGNNLLRQIAGDAGEPRFSMLETMREYALAHLAEAREETYLCKAHAAYYLLLAEDGNSEMAGQLRESWFTRFDAELGNLRAALNWLIAANEAHWGTRMAVALVMYFRNRGLLSESNEFIDKLLALPAVAARSRIRAWLLSAAGDTLVETANDISKKLAFMQESQEIFEELGDVGGVLRTINSQSAVFSAVGDHEAARRNLERLVEVSRTVDDPTVVAGALANLANAVARLGEYEMARRLHEESSSLFEAAGDRVAVAWGFSHLGDLARDQGDRGQARLLYERALERFREMDRPLGVAACCFDLGNLYADTGDYASAERLIGESLKVYVDLGYRPDIPRVLEAFACCAAASARPERALTLAGSAAALRQLVAPAFGASRPKLDRCLEAARKQLSGPQAATSWMQGWSMTAEESVDYALNTS